MGKNNTQQPLSLFSSHQKIKREKAWYERSTLFILHVHRYMYYYLYCKGRLIACMLWQLSEVPATSRGSFSITCYYSSYGNHLLQRTCCCIHCNEKSICGQGNNKALNYSQHTSNQLNVHFSSSSSRPPSLHSPSPHINCTILFLTSLSLNRIKDFPDYYYKCKITSARPLAAGAVMCADHCVLKSIFLRIRGATVHKLIKAQWAPSLSKIMKMCRQ